TSAGARPRAVLEKIRSPIASLCKPQSEPRVPCEARSYESTRRRPATEAWRLRGCQSQKQCCRIAARSLRKFERATPQVWGTRTQGQDRRTSRMPELLDRL